MLWKKLDGLLINNKLLTITSLEGFVKGAPLMTNSAILNGVNGPKRSINLHPVSFNTQLQAA